MEFEIDTFKLRPFRWISRETLATERIITWRVPKYKFLAVVKIIRVTQQYFIPFYCTEKNQNFNGF